jgi:aminoglycoside phosphotransferase (APT) family kinase protein
MQRLPGRSLIIWEPDPVFLAPDAALVDLWVAGARALAAIHRVEHQVHLWGWEDATPLAAELERWASLVRHSQDPSWQDLLHQLCDRLRATMPSDGPVGLVHGDFQPGNILYEQGAITGVIDWDLAMIGSQGIDLGWYLMMADAERWDPGWRPVTTAPKQDLMRAYAQAGGPALSHVGWYQAFAHFRLGSIAGLNLKLHRNGRRQDAIWEKFALSVPSLLRAGLDILGRKDTLS